MEEVRIEELTQLLQEEIDFKSRQRERQLRRIKKEKEEKEKRNRIMFNFLFVTAVASVTASLIVTVITLFHYKSDVYTIVAPNVELVIEDISEPAEKEEIVAANPAVVVQAENVVVTTEGNNTRDFFEQVMAAESYEFWSEQDVLSLATVVMNRVNNPDFPDTVEEVLMQDRQFTTYLNGRYKDAVVTDECKQAVDAALSGKTNLNSNVLWFCTKEYYDNMPEDDFFRSLNHVYTCRNVYFFEEP